MKRFYLLLFTFSSLFVFSQDKWQNQMFNRDANFNDIVADFEIYKTQIMDNSNVIPKGSGIKQFERWKYYWESRVNPDGSFPREGNTMKEMEQYLATHAGSTYGKNYVQGTGNWSIVGPIALPYNGTSQLNGNGRLNCIAFHPTDANTIFVGAPSGGLWKTTDNGQSWVEFSSGLTRLGVSSIVIHPTNPNIIFIATGDRDGNDVPGYGVWKSIDGGLNWSSSNSGMGNRTVNEIIMHPTNPDIMIASASGNRIYRTNDGGLNWVSTSIGTNAKDIAFHPSDPNIIYASGTSLYRSADGGASFTQITSGVPSGAQRIALAVSADEPNWLYLLAGNGSGLMGIYRSTDSGINFSTRTTTPNILGYIISGGDSGSQAWYDLVIAADPTDANVIYTGGINIWKSTDGGANMNIASYWVGSSGGVDGVHADQHALEFSPHNNVLYNGNDGGLYYTNDQGTNWVDISSGLAIAQVYKIGVSQTEAELVINGYQDNGTGISRGSDFITEIGGDGMECIIDFEDENYMYGAVYYGDIRRSTNNGSSFSSIANSIGEQGGWVTPYKLDPNNANTMFAGFDNVWKNTSVRSSSSWTQISNFGGTQNIRDIAIAPSNSNVMYVSRYDNSFRKTTNAQAASPTWTNLTANLPVTNEPVDIEIDPADQDHLFIALNNNIYESTNGGTSWIDISGTLPNISLNTIVIDHNSSVGAMYIGMDVGVYYKDNNLSDWELYSTGFPNIEVTELEIQYLTANCDSRLYASTYAQGLWVSDLKDPGNVAPVACFEVNITSGCVNNKFIFTDKSNFTPTSWTWTISPATYSFTNGTDANSQNPEVVFSGSGTYEVSLTVTNAYGSDIETKPSYITVEDSFNASSFDEDFESQSDCTTGADCGTTNCSLTSRWKNLTNGSEDNIDWRIDTGGTPSNNTGPSVDFNPGIGTGKYLYLEASNGCYGQTAILLSDCMYLDQDYLFRVAYHMFGSDQGSLHVDLFDGSDWIEDIIPSINAENDNQWKILTVDLRPYTNSSVLIRLRGVTGNGFESDLAIDDIKLISAKTYTYNNSWSEDPNGISTILDTINVEAGDTTINTDTDVRLVRVDPGASLTINTGITFNTSITTLKSTSTSFSSLINNGTILGQVNYERFTNSNSNGNDLISAPLAGQTWSDFISLPANQSALLQNPNDPTMYAFAIFDKSIGDYVNFTTSSSANLTSGVGYRSATNTGEVVTFTGTASSSTVTIDIQNSGPAFEAWNLIGNPYSSYLNTDAFLNYEVSPGVTNFSLSESTFQGIYGYNGVANGWTIVNLANASAFSLTPGQGFYFNADATKVSAYDLTFTPSMRISGNTNDFIPMANPSNNLTFFKLNLSTNSQYCDTDVYFNDNATLAQDLGYDSNAFFNNNNLRLYSQLVSGNPTMEVGLQTLNTQNINNVTIPLGVNATAGESITFSASDYDLPSDINVTLDDTQNNSSTSILNNNYSITLANDENGVGRFYLNFINSSLSTDDNNSNLIGVYVKSKTKELTINGYFDEETNCLVYDSLGRLIFEQRLDANTNTQTYQLNNALSSGVYIVKIHSKNSNTEFTKKVLLD